MRIGMHVRGFASGRPVAAANARERGAETIQIFASNPRQWRTPQAEAQSEVLLAEQLVAESVWPLFIHAPYLVNLASPSLETRDLSRRMMEWTLARGRALGATGVIVHAGQCVGGSRAEALRMVGDGVVRLLEGSGEGGPQLLLELTAGSKGAVASRLDQAAELLDACGGHVRLGLCLDTCHLHAAGYDLGGGDGLASLMDELEAEVGIDKLQLIHANDSRDPRGSGRDRHWHIGEGEIGIEGFRAIVKHPAIAHVPLICETPGKADEDRRNIGVLKRLRDDPLHRQSQPVSLPKEG
jgi:deoxyribonuclease IV